MKEAFGTIRENVSKEEVLERLPKGSFAIIETNNITGKFNLLALFGKSTAADLAEQVLDLYKQDKTCLNPQILKNE